MRSKIRLGDLLIQSNVITQEQLQQAIVLQQETGHKLGKVLIENNIVDEQALLNVLAEQLTIPFVELKHYKFDVDVVMQLPETYARRFRAIILKEADDHFLVGMADPLDIFAYDEVTRLLSKPIKQALVKESDLLRSIDLVYRRTEEISGFAEELSDELSEEAVDLATIGDSLGADDAPVVKLIQSLFEDAVQVQASDIHIEPDEHALRIRQRIDGVLYEHVMEERRIVSALTQRLKLMAGLNIAEKRLPQDGRFNIRVRDHSIDVRLSTMPVQFGESVVMRLLDQSMAAKSLQQLGMTDKVLARIEQLIHHPNGMLLVTGPTGSGKTTTLYSVLNELNTVDKKIITVEDPVEYHLPRISQVQVNPKIDLSFASVLRAALRQDPDILMVGEIRDQETATIGLRASITGHLVLATLHTNDAVSSAMRLLDMDIEPYMVASALRAVLAQRLVRRICEGCSKDHVPEGQEQAWLESTGLDVSGISFKQGNGCPHCNNTGYHGRMGVFELLEINSAMREALRANDANGFVRAAAESEYSKPLGEACFELAKQGMTTLSEVMRVTGELEESYERIGSH